MVASRKPDDFDPRTAAESYLRNTVGPPPKPFDGWKVFSLSLVLVLAVWIFFVDVPAWLPLVLWLALVATAWGWKRRAVHRYGRKIAEVERFINEDQDMWYRDNHKMLGSDFGPSDPGYRP